MKENHRKNNGVYLQTTHISASIYHKLQNLAPNQSLDNYVFFYYLVGIYLI